MDGVAARPMTVEEFLAWEARQEQRYEFDGARPVAMTGGTRAHNIISVNLASLLLARLRGGPCRPYAADMKIRIGRQICYPDVVVSCGPEAMSDIVDTAPVVLSRCCPPAPPALTAW